MKIVIAIDSFKGSMTSLEAGAAAAQGIYRCCPDAEICLRPIADGGEGTVEALVAGMGGKLREITVTGPLGQRVNACYGILGETAVMEMAAAAGIALVPREALDPWRATTYGVGELIRDAIAQGCRRFLMGIGGSATNDGGVGMLQALGFAFLDAAGNPVDPGTKGLSQLAEISDKNVLPELKDCTFCVACDVDNPLCGTRGCSAVYGPQKGAAPGDISQMDGALAHYAQLTKMLYHHADPEAPGAGAAGGLGFALQTYLHGQLTSGIRLILEQIGLEDCLRDADLVITGEGRIDSQTVMGKAPVGVAAMAKKYGIPVLAFAGCVSRDGAVCNAHGIDGIFPIVRGACTLAEAMDNRTARENMADTVEQVMRLWLTARRSL